MIEELSLRYRQMDVVDLETGRAVGERSMPSVWDPSIPYVKYDVRALPQLGHRLPDPLTNLVVYAIDGALGLRWIAERHGFEAEIALPRRIEVRPGQDLRRLFFEEVNAKLEKPLVPPHDGQAENTWKTDSAQKWRRGTMQGQIDDLGAVVRTLLARRNIFCSDGVMIIWLATKTQNHAPRFKLSPFEPVRRGSFWKIPASIIEEIRLEISTLGPGLLARNHPSGFEYRRIGADTHDPDLLARFRLCNMEEMPKTTTIPVEGIASLSMHDTVAEAARVEEIRAESTLMSQDKG